MRIPRFRLKTLMIAVAVVAALLGRWVNFRSRAESHRQERRKILVSDLEFYLACTAAQGDAEYRHLPARAAARPLMDFVNYHETMFDKYAQAFRQPWLPVASDPPAPPLPSNAYQKAFRGKYLSILDRETTAPGTPTGNRGRP